VADRGIPALRDPAALVEKHGYAPLTRAMKEQIFGLNAARVFGVDVNAARHEIPMGLREPDQDVLSRRGAGTQPSLVRLGHSLRPLPCRAAD